MRTCAAFLSLLIVVGCERPQGDDDKADVPDQRAGNGQEKAPDPAPAKQQEKAAAKAVPGDYDRTASAPIPKQKWDVRHAEKNWGIEMKGFKYVETVWASEKGDRQTTYHLLLQFTRDVPEKEMRSLREAFRPSSPPSPNAIDFVVIDEDNVLVARMNTTPTVKGELTGVKGDAFWLVVQDSFDFLMKDLGGIRRVKRVEMRTRMMR